MKTYVNKLNSFTLAEMMVVMLILTILLAAFAPLMTKRKSVDVSSSPWRYATNNSDIYYGLADSQTAMIGQNTKASTDPGTKLLIKNSSDSQAFITFKNDEVGVLGGIYWQAADVHGGTLRIGGPYTTIAAGGESLGVGYMSLNKASGDDNTALGALTLTNNTTGSNNTAVGANSLKSNTTGASNTALGVSALYSNTTTGNSTAVGFRALTNNTAGGSTAVGSTALYSNTTGNYNTALGYQVMYSNTTGSNNTAVGYYALKNNTTSSYNTALGYGALYGNTTGSCNTALGNEALLDNTTGQYNTALGYHALYFNRTGSNNTALGYYACNLVKGSNKTCIGYNAGPTSEDSTTTNVVYLGSSSTSKIVSGVTAISTYSDKRLKNVKSQYKNGLESIRDIVPVNFTYKNDKDKTLRVGVIAQDLQKILPDAVEKNGDGYLVVNQGNLFYTLLNAVKQLDNLVQALINELKVFEYKIDTLIIKQDRKIKELEKRLDKLEKRSV